MTAAVSLVLGTGADAALGDPQRGHPVAGFGTLVQAAERRWYAPTRLRGALLTGGAVVGTGASVWLVDRALRRRPVLRTLVGSAVVWTTLGGRSLASVGDALAGHLERDDLAAARALLPSLAGRDPSQLDASGIARAGIESVAENTSDAVLGALFYGAAFGPAGAAAYRAANTLDAMVGHHSERYEDFGWASARLDDVLGWLPARLGAALTALVAPVVGGSRGRAARVWLRDRSAHPSPNAGQMEAAFAGALGVRLGGPLMYGTRAEVRGTLGAEGRDPDARGLRGAVTLSRAVSLLTLGVVLVGRAAVVGRGARNRRAGSGSGQAGATR